MAMTISEALTYIKSLKARHSQLMQLQQENSYESTRYAGEKGVVVKTPQYIVKNVDKKINLVAGEIRKLEMAIKKANAITEISYQENEDVFSAIE